MILAMLIRRLFTRHEMPESSVDALLQAHADGYKAEHGQALDWRNSIVDVMKALGLDSSFENRRDMWADLCMDGKYEGTAEQNLEMVNALRKQVARGEFGRP